MIFGWISAGRSEFVVKAHGYLTFSSYVNGTERTDKLLPRYRAEDMTYIDFIRWGNLYFSTLLGNTTLISGSRQTAFQMDRIRYTLSPVFRYEFRRWMIRGTVFHECIHVLDRPEQIYPGFRKRGTIYWNSFQIGLGSRGSYYLYLRERYSRKYNQFVNSWDAQINIGKFLPAEGTMFTGQNHLYRYEVFTLVRYHLGVYNNWASFIGINQHLWLKSDHSNEQTYSMTLNLFRKGNVNFAGVFYTYTFYDTFSPDNEDGRGALGLKILF